MKTSRKADSDKRAACKLCNKSYENNSNLQAHVRDVHGFCPTCRQGFGTKFQLWQHQHDADHCWRREHRLPFTTAAGLRAHRMAEPHITGFECLICDQEFSTQQGLDDHLNDKIHPEALTSGHSAAADAAKAATEEANLHCVECDRGFIHLGAYRQHKDSVKHKPLSDLQCPLSTGCGTTFTSPSALIFHLESGSCKSGMNRLKLNAVVHQHDTARHITDEKNVAGLISAASSVDSLKSKMSSMSLASSGSAVAAGSVTGLTSKMSSLSFTSSGSGVVIDTPDDSDDASVISESSGVLLTPSITTAHSRTTSFGGVILTPTGASDALSEWSYINGAANMTPTTSAAASTTDTITYQNPNGTWPCTMCDKTFKKHGRLLQHLNSVAHATEIFHCPTALVGLHTGGTSKAFKTLSGMAQHIEAGTCAGGRGTLDMIVGIFESKIKAATGRDVKLLCAKA
ncbi:hypothetical protein LTR08_006162 [Meristemomyces frigidus]|nr:hypothetical protein LTR08_006162 [Meristemomyces frigidus]